MSIVEIHSRLSNTALLYFVLITAWAYWRFFRKEGLSPGFWGSLVIAEILLLLQSGLGAYMWITGLRPARDVHILYGIVSLMALPAVYMFTKGRQERSEMLMYGTTALITIGLIMRAVFTATGG